MSNASWVIVRRATGEGVMETFNAELLPRLNAERYVAAPIMDYLCEFNRRIRAAGGVEPPQEPWPT